MKNNSIHLALAVLRIALSGMFLTHGIPKINRLFAEDIQFADPIGIGPVPSLVLTLIAEVIAPIFIIIGFKTKFAAIPAIATMLVAAFIQHGADPFSTKEKALLYLLGFFVIFIAGSGKYSVDKK